MSTQTNTPEKNQRLLEFLTLAVSTKPAGIHLNFQKQFRLETSQTTTPLKIDYDKLTRHPDLRKMILNFIDEENEKIINQAEIIVGIESVGCGLASIIANEKGKKLITLNDMTKFPKNVALGKCIIIKDEIVDGRMTIPVIDSLQKKGFDCLGIITIFSENLQITKERFAGQTGVKEHETITKLEKACAVNSIITPQKFYEALMSSQDGFVRSVAVQYNQEHRFSLLPAEKVEPSQSQPAMA